MYKERREVGRLKGSACLDLNTIVQLLSVDENLTKRIKRGKFALPRFILFSLVFKLCQILTG